MEIKGNQNIFDFTLEKFGTLENLFDDVLVPNSLPIDRETQSNQEVNINAVGKGDDDVKMKISEQGLSMTNGDIAAAIIPPVIDLSFKMSINTALGTGDNFQLPLPSGETYNFVVDWGDDSSDTITAYNQAETLHTYSSAFNGQISITGKCGGWFFNNTGDKLKPTNIDNWGDVGFDKLDSAFIGCSNIVSFPDNLIYSGTSLKNFAAFCTNLTTVNANNWSVASVTDFSGFFHSGLSITTLEVANWDTSSGSNFQAFIFNCSSLTGINSDNWDISTADRVDLFASGCTGLITFNTDNWDTSDLDTCSGMCNGCINLTSSFDNTLWWDRTIPIPSFGNTFTGAVNISNYASIPNGWKGL